MGSLLREITLAPRALFPLAGALLQLALALFLVAASGERRLRFAFALVALCAAVWSFCTSVALATARPSVALWAVQGSLAAIALAGPSAFQFAASMTRARPRWLLPMELFAALVALSVMIFPSLLVVAPRPHGGFWPRPSVGFALVVAACLPAIGLGAVTLARVARSLPPSRRRRQLVWAAAALATGGIGGLDVHTIFDRGYPLGWLSSTLSCGTLFYAIVQYRLMAIRTVARRMAVMLLGLAALGGWLLLMSARGRTLTPLEAAAWVLLGFAGMRAWSALVAPALLRLFDGRRRRLEAALTEFERRSLDARSRDDVRAHLGHAVEQVLLGARLVSLLSSSELPPLPAPVLRDLIDLDAADAPRLLATLDRLSADALVPISRHGEPLGTAVLAGGALRSADDDLAELLGRVGEAAGRALTSAQLYQEVARRSTGLEAQVRLRTAELENALGDLTSTQAKLAEAERSSALGLLVAGVSHEINNALNFISANLPTLGRYLTTYGEVIARAQPTGATIDGGIRRIATVLERAPATAALLGDAVRRTSAIVEDLRRFARPDTERRVLFVTEGLDAALNLLRRRTDGRLDVARLYAGAGTVEGYPGPLNQSFFNLLLNAVEAARSEIWVEVHESEAGVEVVIRDDGEGVPGDLTDQIFQPFFTTRPKSAGLGLTVSRSIVERHGGTLHLSSPNEGGARVRVRLPARAPEPK